jgi:dTDP-D-glucose 4,6-dehydratase
MTQVVILDKLDYCSSLKNVSRALRLCGGDRVKFVKGGIRSFDLVLHVLNTERIDTVMHFAAQSHVENSFNNSFEFTKTKHRGHARVARSMSLGSERYSTIPTHSTDEVYGESALGELNNDSNTEHATLLAPTNPYAASKAGAEMLVMACGRSYNLPFIITRGSNIYGPNQYPEKAIPNFTILAKLGNKYLFTETDWRRGRTCTSTTRRPRLMSFYTKVKPHAFTT